LFAEDVLDGLVLLAAGDFFFVLGEIGWFEDGFRMGEEPGAILFQLAHEEKFGIRARGGRGCEICRGLLEGGSDCAHFCLG
jgi:hypothetical protein